MTPYHMCEWTKLEIKITYGCMNVIVSFCREVNFMLQITPGGNSLSSLDEGVEFGYRMNDSPWIPLAFYSSTTERDDGIRIGELVNGDTLTIRGYSVPFIQGDTQSAQLKLCGSDIIQNNALLSFRWLQTSSSVLDRSVDDITLDDVQISTFSPQQHVLEWITLTIR